METKKKDELKFMEISDKYKEIIDLANKVKKRNFQVILEQEVIKENNPVLSYYFATRVIWLWPDNKKFVIDDKAIVQNKNYQTMVNMVDKKAHGKVIINSKDSELNYYFARDVIGADIEAHRDVVLKGSESRWIYYFLRDIEPKEIEKHRKAILNLKNAFWNYEFAKGYGDKDHLHGRVVASYKDPKLNYHFANNVKDARVIDHAPVVIESEDVVYNYLFARDIEGSNPIEHGKVVIASKNLEYNYKFLRDVEGADLSAHASILAENKDKDFSYLKEYDNDENVRILCETVDKIKKLKK